jgi:D-amino-acid oxidase
MDVLVVGSGVVGLSVAVRLREAGLRADVAARESAQDTTSAVAAALWYPYRAWPEHLVTHWSAVSYEEFARLARTGEAPVAMRPGRELLRSPTPDPWWVDAVPDFGRVSRGNLPSGFVDGFGFTAPVIDMAEYLSWLATRLRALDGSVRSCEFSNLEQALAESPVVVNCSGLGARSLVPDPTVQPVRGQVVRLGQVGLTEWVLDEAYPRRPTYVVPRTHDIVCGGVADEGDWRLEVDPGTAEDILARCRALVPALAEAPVIAHRVGLRPARPTVRLEVEPWSTGTVVHCYGHGGAGVTLSWGCADEVTAIVAGLL